MRDSHQKASQIKKKMERKSAIWKWKNEALERRVTNDVLSFYVQSLPPLDRREGGPGLRGGFTTRHDHTSTASWPEKRAGFPLDATVLRSASVWPQKYVAPELDRNEGHKLATSSHSTMRTRRSGGCDSLSEHVSDLAGSPRRGFRPLLGPGQLLILRPVLLGGRPAQLRDLLELVHLHTARHAGGGRGSRPQRGTGLGSCHEKYCPLYQTEARTML
jgi:hypothetical protein